jgi:hypothetical protein
LEWECTFSFEFFKVAVTDTEHFCYFSLVDQLRDNDWFQGSVFSQTCQLADGFVIFRQRNDSVFRDRPHDPLEVADGLHGNLSGVHFRLLYVLGTGWRNEIIYNKTVMSILSGSIILFGKGGGLRHRRFQIRS